MTVKQAAGALGLSTRRVYDFLRSGRLRGCALHAGHDGPGRRWWISESALAEFRRAPRRPGRPRKIGKRSHAALGREVAAALGGPDGPEGPA